MNKNQISQEWKKLKFELLENRPKINGPYPPDTVKRRELLLYAEVCLTNISDAKNKKDERIEGFETKLYNTIMSAYCNWDTANEKIYNFSYK